MLTEIREAKEFLECMILQSNLHLSPDQRNAIQLFINLANSLTTVEMPQKKSTFNCADTCPASCDELNDKQYGSCPKDAYNQAIDDCTAFFARQKAEWMERIDEEKILKIIEDCLECKDDDVIGCHINGKNLAAHSLTTYLKGEAKK
jgi:hypothetical protein